MIYLDNAATTPVDPRVREVLLAQYSLSAVGNPHSEHAAGDRAHAAAETARAQIATLIGAQPAEIIFTSGATEANNLVLQGIARQVGVQATHLIVSAIEHKCILETALALRTLGAHVDIVPVRHDGMIDLDRLRALLTEETTLVSVMAANNEVGVLQPIAEIAELCTQFGVPFHTDAAQAAGKIPVDVVQLGVDFLSLSAHKLYGPLGVGALYLSAAAQRLPQPLFFGGGQERGYRPGTLPVPLCAGFGEACAIAQQSQISEAHRLAYYKQRLITRLRQHDIEALELLPKSACLPGLTSLEFPGIDAAELVGAVQPELAVSTMAACTAGTLQASHVLTALGLSSARAASVLRVGIGRFNTLEDVERAADLLAAAARRQSARLRTFHN